MTRRRRRGWAGWVGDGVGPSIAVHADREPSGEAITALLALRDAVIARMREEERALDRWEDDGGRPAPERTRPRLLLQSARSHR